MSNRTGPYPSRSFPVPPFLVFLLPTFRFPAFLPFHALAPFPDFPALGLFGLSTLPLSIRSALSLSRPPGRRIPLWARLIFPPDCTAEGRFVSTRSGWRQTGVTDVVRPGIACRCPDDPECGPGVFSCSGRKPYGSPDPISGADPAFAPPCGRPLAVRIRILPYRIRMRIPFFC